jgi:hypothetical protein
MEAVKQIFVPMAVNGTVVEKDTEVLPVAVNVKGPELAV